MAADDASAAAPGRIPRAQGEPIPESVATAAATWLTQAMAGELDGPQRERWRQWRAAHPDHERAWLHVEAVLGRFQALEQAPAARALAGLRKPSRRKLVFAPLWLAAGAGAAGLAASRTPTGRAWVADLRTATGELRWVTLDDGSRLLLGTGTALDIEFDASQRAIALRAGEIFVATAHGDPRPFSVRTPQGSVRPLGTRFSVRLDPDGTMVGDEEGAVELRPLRQPDLALRVAAGESAYLTQWAPSRAEPLPAQALAWTRGQLIADDERLGDFIANLSRFRPGILRCDPAVADLRFSGVFPIADTDHILALLPNSLPVAIRQVTRYWVTVVPRAG